MTLRSRIVAGVLSVLAVTAPAQGQDNTSVGPVLAVGSRVRIESTAIQARLKGFVVALDETVVTLATDGGLVKIPLTSITALDASLGRKRNWLKGAAIGLGVGLIIGLTTPVDPNDCGLSSNNECSRGAALGSGFLGGGLLGAGIGALIKTDRWSAGTRSAARPRARDGGATPTVQMTAGFSMPQLPQAQFPGFTGSVAVVRPSTSTWGMALVADVDASYLMLGRVAGARVYGRSRLFSERKTVTFFSQLLLGAVTGSVQGVLRSEGGFVVEPSVGLDYGAGPLAFRLQVGYRNVANGVVYDSRVPGQPVDRLSGPRGVLGMTWRLRSR